MTPPMIDAESARAARHALLQVLVDLIEGIEALAISTSGSAHTDDIAAAGRDIAIIAEALAVVSRGRP